MRPETNAECLTRGTAPRTICNALVQHRPPSNAQHTHTHTHDPHPPPPLYRSLGRYPVFIAPTQPFGGRCHLIRAEDDSHSAMRGAKAAEESLSLYPVFASIIQHSRPPPTLLLLLILLLTPSLPPLPPSLHCFFFFFAATLPCALLNSICNDPRYQSTISQPSGTGATQVSLEQGKVPLPDVCRLLFMCVCVSNIYRLHANPAHDLRSNSRHTVLLLLCSWSVFTVRCRVHTRATFKVIGSSCRSHLTTSRLVSGVLEL